jgi:hypothetical protein
MSASREAFFSVLDLAIFGAGHFLIQWTGCCRTSHSTVSRRTVSLCRTASAAIVSSRCFPPSGSFPSFFL